MDALLGVLCRDRDEYVDCWWCDDDGVADPDSPVLVLEALPGVGGKE